MAYSAWVKWTLAQLRASARDELLDPYGKFWSDDELNGYIGDWQDRLQNDHEFIWGTSATVVGSATSTLTLATIAPTMRRLDKVYWNDQTGTNTQRLVGRSIDDLNALQRNWRSSVPYKPLVVYQQDVATISLWPPPETTGTLIMHFPVTTTFATDTDTMAVPAWTRHSAKNYTGYRAYLRSGPNNNLAQASKYKARFLSQDNQFRVIQDAFLPEKFLFLQPATPNETKILYPGGNPIPDAGIVKI